MIKSESSHLKSLYELWVILGIYGINKPIIFACPTVFNLILAIPFIVTPIVTVCLEYLAQVMGLITPGYLVDPSFAPFFASIFLFYGLKKCFIYIRTCSFKCGYILSIL